MAKEDPSLIEKLLSPFTIVQKFIIISCIFGMSLIVALSWMISVQNRAIKTVTIEIKGNRYEKLIRIIYSDIAFHRRVLKNIIIDKNADKTYLTQLENEINSGFEKLIAYNREVQGDLNTQPIDFENRETRNLSPEELQQRWILILQNIPNITNLENNNSHLNILEDFQDLAFYITEQSNLLQDPAISNYYLIHTLYWILTENMRTIPSINIELEDYLQNKKTNPEKAKEDLKKVKELLTIFNLHLKETKENIKKVITYEKNFNNNLEIEKVLQEPYNELLDAFEKYSDSIQKSLSNKDVTKTTPEELLKEIKNVYDQNFALSNIISNTLEKILENRLMQLKYDQWISISSILAIALIAFALGIAVMRSIIKPLNQMMKSAISIGNGDLSNRVPVHFNDEAGKVGKAFNKMADSIQDLLKQLQWAGIQLTSSTTEIAATAKEQEITVMEQESAVKQIAVTAQEISATTKDFANTMREISETAEKTSSLATSGKEGLQRMEVTMRQMVDAASNIASKLAVLNEKAGTITGVVTTISKVADQTNLLSLNAAIEAEKAGEHGRSFVIIAREMRRLADQTANSTLDIEKMVNEMVSAVSAGVMGVDKFTDEINSGVTQVTIAGEQLSKIIEQVQQLISSFESVNNGMQTQFQGAAQINESILQLSETAQQTSESIRQFHKAIEQLNNAAQELKSMVITNVKQ